VGTDACGSGARAAAAVRDPSRFWCKSSSSSEGSKPVMVHEIQAGSGARAAAAARDPSLCMSMLTFHDDAGLQ